MRDDCDRREAASFVSAGPAWSSFVARYDVAVGALVLLIVLTLTFSPFIWGGRTLQESASDSASLYWTGSHDPALGHIGALNVLDPGAAAWATEPQLALEHDIMGRERTAPIWNPYVAYGAPLAANMHSQPYSPLAWIPIVWSTARAYNIFIVLRLYIAGLFTFLYMREFVPWRAALVSGASYMFAGYLLLYLTMPHLSVEVLTPALLYGIERMLRRPNLRTMALFAAFLACSVLGGMPESTFLAVSFAYLYLIVRLLSDKSTRRNSGRLSLQIVTATILAGGLSACASLPFLEYVAVSFNLHSSGFFGNVVDPVSWNVLGTYLSPMYEGTPYQNIFTGFSGWTLVRGFFGCGAIFFSLIALCQRMEDLVRGRPRDKLPITFFGIVALVLLAKRFGFVLVTWLGHLPGFSDIIFPKYEEAIIALCVAALAGAGVSAVCERRVSNVTLWFATLAPLALLTIVAVENASKFAHLRQHTQFYLLGLSTGLTVIAVLSVAAYVRSLGKMNSAIFAALAFTVIAAEPLVAYVIPMEYILNDTPPLTASALLGAPYVDFLKSHLRSGERVFGSNGILYPEWSAVFNISDATSLDALYTSRYLPFVRAFLTGNAGDDLTTRFTGVGHDLSTALAKRFLSLSSVRFVGANASAMDPTEYRIVYKDPAAQMYEFRSPLPRVGIYRRVLRVTDGTAALATIAAESFDPSQEAVVEGEIGGLAELARAKRARVTAGRIEAYSSRYVRASLTTVAPSLVLLTDTAFPGWTATVDGRAVPIVNANYMFRGVVVRSGKHVVEYHYDPVSFTIGSRVTIVSLLVFVTMLLFPQHKRRAEVSSEISAIGSR